MSTSWEERSRVENELKQDFHTKMPKVAAILGAKIRNQQFPDSNPIDHGYYLTLEHDSGVPMDIWVSLDTYRKKIHAYYSMPRYRAERYYSLRDMGIIGYNESDPSDASMSPTKTVEQLAKDLARRVIAPARELHTKFVERRKDKEASVNKRDAMAALIAKRLGVSVPEAKDSDSDLNVTLYDRGNISYCNVRISVGGHVYLDRLSLKDNSSESVVDVLAAMVGAGK